MNRNSLGETKRKLRQLKKLEKKIRCIGDDGECDLIWNDFFVSKYPLKIVAAMDKESYKKVVEEYFYYVYYKFYVENKSGDVYYDPEILSRLGLPLESDIEMIRQRFRELAKIYHPDAGGDAGDFIKLKEDYDNLIHM